MNIEYRTRNIQLPSKGQKEKIRHGLTRIDTERTDGKGQMAEGKGQRTDNIDLLAAKRHKNHKKV